MCHILYTCVTFGLSVWVVFDIIFDSVYWRNLHSMMICMVVSFGHVTMKEGLDPQCVSHCEQIQTSDVLAHV